MGGKKSCLRLFAIQFLWIIFKLFERDMDFVIDLESSWIMQFQLLQYYKI